MRNHLYWASVMPLLLAACAGQSEPSARTAASSNTPFTQALASGYGKTADFERGEYDYRDANIFQRKADMAANGQVPTIEDPTKRGVGTGFQLSDGVDIGKEQRDEAIAGHQRLQTALDGGGAQRNPQAAARAQVSYDCWVEQLEEGWQRNDIERCRSAFNTAMAELTRPQTASALNVYFNSDSAQLTPKGRETIASAAQQFRQGGAKTVEVAGHADRAGSDAYNQQLSVRRAEAVKQELAAAGVPADRIVTRAYGERDPAVATQDGVSATENRRSMIEFD